MEEVLESFLALKPERKIFDFISDHKNRCKEVVGPQTFLEDKPHLTLYVACLDTEDSLFSAINCLNLDISHNIYFDGWEVFESDPVTMGVTVVLKVSSKSISSLRNAQDHLVDIAKRYRNIDTPPRYHSGKYNEVMKSNLEKTGYPFVGEVWKPHLTVASFTKKAFSIVGETILKSPTPEVGKFQALDLFTIKESKNKLIRTWEL